MVPFLSFYFYITYFLIYYPYIFNLDFHKIYYMSNPFIPIFI